MTAPDRDLLAAVAEALASHGAPSQQRPNDLAFRAGAAALAAAGRILAERLAAIAHAETERSGRARARQARRDSYLVARWCGAEPEGDGDGA